VSLVLCSLTVSQKIALYHDRIELSNAFGSHTIFRKDIERLDTIIVGNEKNKTIWHYLVPQLPNKFLMPIPADMKIDSAWLKWFADIPENTIDKSGDNQSSSAIYIAFIVTVFLMTLLIIAAIVILSKYKSLFNSLSFIIVVGLPFSAPLLLKMVTDTRYKKTHQAYMHKIGIGLLVTMLAVSFLLLDWNGIGAFAIQSDIWIFDLLSIVLILLFMLTIFYRHHRALILNRPMLLTALLFVATYGYLSPLIINGLFDHSRPQFAKPAIEGKFYRAGKRSGWYLTLASWGPETRKREYKASNYVYAQLKINDRICAQLHQGALGVRWYKLSETCPGTLASVPLGTEAPQPREASFSAQGNPRSSPRRSGLVDLSCGPVPWTCHGDLHAGCPAHHPTRRYLPLALPRAL